MNSIQHQLLRPCAWLLSTALIVLLLVLAYTQTSLERTTLANSTSLAGNLLVAELKARELLQTGQNFVQKFGSLKIHPPLSRACLYSDTGQLMSQLPELAATPCSAVINSSGSAFFGKYHMQNFALSAISQTNARVQVFSDQSVIWKHVLAVLLPFSAAALVVFLSVLVLGRRLGERATESLGKLRDSLIQISLKQAHGEQSSSQRAHTEIQDPKEVREVAQAFNTVLESMFEARQLADKELIQHQQTQHTLLQTETLLRTIIDIVPYIVFAVRGDGSVVFANKAMAELYDTNIPDLINGSFQTAHIHKDADGLLFANQAASPAPQEIWLNDGRGKTGRYIITRTSFHPVDASHACTLVIAIDITERRRLQVQLQFSQRLEVVGTLAGGIAHDFNNLLTPIMGYATILLDQDHSDATKEKLDGIYIASLKARDLVQQILTFSRQRDDELEKQKLNPQSLLDESILLLRATIPTTINIESTSQQNIKHILADSGQISQVIVNLCTNSAQALANTANARIKIQLSNSETTDPDRPDELEQGEYICLSVEDNGEGMRDEIAAHVFEPFFTTKVVGEGSGLGLSVVHGIVTSHGGQICVESKLGKGTKFSVYLPTVKQAELPTPQGLKPRDTIILVDDEITVLRATKDLLDQSGYNVHAFVDAESALACYRECPEEFDALLTDNFMPNMSGLELAHEVKKINSNLPIVLISGFIDKPAETDPCIDYRVMKPVSGRDLSRIVADVILNTGNTNVEHTEKAATQTA